jgi:hypothetical protein
MNAGNVYQYSTKITIHFYYKTFFSLIMYVLILIFSYKKSTVKVLLDFTLRFQ